MPAGAQNATGYTNAPLVGKLTPTELAARWMKYLRANLKPTVESIVPTLNESSFVTSSGLPHPIALDAPTNVGASIVSSTEQTADVTLGTFTTLSATTGRPTTSGPTNTDVVWSHDESFLVFASNATTSLSTGHYHLYVVSSSGGPLAYNGSTPVYVEQLTGLTEATADYDERYPSLLGQGDTSIAYCEDTNATGSSAYQLVTAAFGATASGYAITNPTLVAEASSLEARHPYYTANEIFFSGRPIDSGDDFNIWVVSSTSLTQLTGPSTGVVGLDEDNPNLSSGNLLVWDTNAASYSYSSTGTALTAASINSYKNIWSATPSGNDAIQLTASTTSNCEHPVWSTTAGSNSFVGGVNASADVFFESDGAAPLPGGTPAGTFSLYYYPAYSNLSDETQISSATSAGTDEVPVVSTAGFAAGDEVEIDQGVTNLQETGTISSISGSYLVLTAGTNFSHSIGATVQLVNASASLQTLAQAGGDVEVNTSNSTHAYNDEQPAVSELNPPYISVAYISSRYLVDNISDNPLAVNSLSNSTLAGNAVAAGDTNSDTTLDSEPFSSTNTSISLTPASDVFVSRLEDVDPPSLITFNAGTPSADNTEIVHVYPGDLGAYVKPTPTSTTTHLVQAGDDATFVVRLSERQAGVGQAWLEIKDPESSDPYSEGQDSTGLEHKVYTHQHDANFFHDDINEATELFDHRAIAGYDGANRIVLGNQAIYTTGANAGDPTTGGATTIAGTTFLNAGTTTIPVTNLGAIGGVNVSGENVILNSGAGTAEVVHINGYNNTANPNTISVSGTAYGHGVGETITVIQEASSITSDLNSIGGDYETIPIVSNDNDGNNLFNVGDIIAISTTGSVPPAANAEEAEITAINGNTLTVDESIIQSPATRTTLLGMSGTYNTGDLIERVGTSQFDPMGQEVDCEAVDTSLTANGGSPDQDLISGVASNFYIPTYTPGEDDGGAFTNAPTDIYASTTISQAVGVAATSIKVASLTTFNVVDGDQITLNPGGLDSEVVTVLSTTASPPTINLQSGTKFAHAQLETVTDYSTDTYWLKLQPMPAADQDSNGGVLYYATWNTPLDPSDYYVDVIAEGASANENWKIYDNVWGFTTQSFQGSNSILVVNDYALPQKFYDRGDLSSSNVPAHIYGTESYWTELSNDISDWQTHYNNAPESVKTVAARATAPTAVLPLVAEDLTQNGVVAQRAKLTFGVYNGTGTLDVPYFPAYANGLGINAYVDDNMSNQTQITSGGVTTTLPNSEKYDIWRVLSRGPIPSTTLLNYAGSPKPQPANPLGPSPTTALTTFVAPECVVWLSPYSGDVFAGPGTITDAATQTELDTYLQGGGRLHIEGKDIGYALTQDGSIANSFYTNDLNNNYNPGNAVSAFITDDVGDGNNVTTLTGSQGVADSISDDAFTTGVNHIDLGGDGYILPTDDVGDFQYSAPYQSKLTIAHGIDDINDTTSRTDASLDCFTESEGTSFIDGFNTSALTQLVGTTNREVFYRSSAPAGSPYFGSIVSYSSFGIATISQQVENLTLSPGNNYLVINQRSNLIHNIVCTLRTGSLTGHITSSGQNGQGAQAIQNAVVIAAPSAADVTTNTDVYTGTTDSTGLYTIHGVPPGQYSITAYKEGYSFQHSNAIVTVHGGDTNTISGNVSLTTAGSGSLQVTVVDTNGVAIPNATVTPSEVAGGTAPSPLTAPTTSPNIFLFSSIATGVYSVTVSAPLFASSTVTPVDISQGTQTTITVQLTPLVPTAPTSLTATPGNTQVTLSWTASTDAPNFPVTYDIYRGTATGQESATPVYTGVSTTVQIDSGLTNGQPYYYTVAGVNSAGIGPMSSEATATPQVPAPSAPTNLIATPGNTQVSLSWTASATAVSYNVYRGTSHNAESYVTSINTSPVTTTTYVDTGLTDGSTYYYTVEAVNAGGSSGPSNEASATPALPSAPTLLTATAGNTQITLNWDTSGAYTYNIYRATSAGGEVYTSAPINSSPVSATTYTDTGLTNGTPYYYTVVAVSAGASSSPSNEASATPQIPAAPAPAGLTATAVAGQTTINLSWTASATAASYNIYRGTSPGAENYGTPINTSPVTTTTYSDTAVVNGTPYYYTVEAVNAGGNSAPSNEATATPELPVAPASLTAVAGNTQVTLSWTASAGDATYNIYRGTSGGAESATPINATPTSATTYTDTGLVNGQTYYYYVRGINTGGTSVASNEVSATPYYPAVPANLSATAGNNQVALTWTASSGATSYNVYRGTVAGGENYSTPINSAPITTATYTDTGLTNGVTYYYKVVALTSIGASTPSNEASATPIAPPGPTALTATAENTEVTLSWTASAGALSYNVYRGTSAGGESATPVYSNVAGTTQIDSGLTNGTTYYYTVAANTASGTSAFSNEAAGTPQVPVSGPPTNLTAASAAGTNTITLNWTAAVGASSYNVYRGTSAGNESGTPVATGVTGTAYTDAGLTTGTTYYYKLAAVNPGGTSGLSNEASAATVLPSAPTSLTATGGNAQVVLNWTAPTGAATYNIYRGTTSGGESSTPVNSSAVSGTTYTDTGLTNGKKYYYTVAAVNTAGTGAVSNEASATPQIVAPAAPASLTATPGQTKITLAWTASATAATYNVYRGTSSGGEATTPIYTGIATTTQVDSGLSNGTTYYYTVAAVNVGGTSGYSNEASAKPEANLHLFSTGLAMIAAPVDDSGYTLTQEFDEFVKFAVWNPSSSSYTISPNSPADTIVPGQGYWARFTTPTNLLDLGTTVSATQPVSVSLTPGWNMIGVPRSSAVASSSIRIEFFGQSGGTSYTFADAVTAGLISNTLYTYQAGDTAYEVISGANGNLQPYYGYWIYVLQPCTFYFAAQ